MKHGKLLLSFMLALVLVLGLVPEMGLTAKADNSLVGTIIKKNDTFTRNNDYIEYSPGQSAQGNGEYTLMGFGY